MDAEIFTKTRHDELIRTHCRWDFKTSMLNTMRTGRRRLNTLNTWNCAVVNPVSFLPPFWTANKRARTTDSENTVVTRTSNGFGCEQSLVVSQDTSIITICARNSKRNAHRTRPVLKLLSSERQDIISATCASTFSSLPICSVNTLTVEPRCN